MPWAYIHISHIFAYALAYTSADIAHFINVMALVIAVMSALAV
jgi:hypothetical protein